MNKKLAVRDIVNYVKWRDVKRAIRYYYPTDHNNYEKLFYKIAKMPRFKTEPGETLVVGGGLAVKTEWFEKYGQKYLDDLKTGDESMYYSVNLKKVGEPYTYSMSFIKWKKFVNYPIDLDTLENFNFVDIIAHVLWEMTFYGSETETQKHAKKLHKMVDEIKSGKAKTEPLNMKKYDNKTK
jgi:hypothetical protein